MKLFMLNPRLPNGCSFIVKGISKSTVRKPLGPYTFLHKIILLELKKGPVFKKFMILIS